MIVKHDISYFQTFFPTQGQQFGITWAGANQIDMRSF
jgi:hypothetical protein